MGSLTEKKCTACQVGVPPFEEAQVQEWMAKLGDTWAVVSQKRPDEPMKGGAGTMLRKKFSFKNFKETMIFVNKVAALAEEEGHHPDLHVSYGKVIVDLWTHKIGGLWENDFILAAKIDELRS